MDIDRLLAHLASLPPSERPELVLQLGVPRGQIAAQLHRLEQMALQRGYRLRGGASVIIEGEEGEGEGDEGIGGGDGAQGSLSYAQVRKTPPPFFFSSSPPAPVLASPLALSLITFHLIFLMQLWEVTKRRAYEWGGLALFWGAVPLVLLLIKERRGLSWGAVAAQALRLPFCD